MGEFSEYFEDFPEENPANWTTGPVDPLADLKAKSGQPASTFPDRVREAIDARQTTAFSLGADGSERA